MNIPTFLLLAVLLFTGCKDQSSQTSDSKKPTRNTLDRKNGLLHTEDFLIPADSANKMISSYLTSIHADSNDEDLHSVIIDAGALRSYLATSAASITKVKLMFAHQLNYINEGNKGVNCGYNQKGLTLIIAGYDNEGNYVFLPGNNVLNHAMPCPSSCPTVGNAQRNLLVQ